MTLSSLKEGLFRPEAEGRREAYQTFSPPLPNEELTRPVSVSYVMVALPVRFPSACARFEPSSCIEMQFVPPPFVLRDIDAKHICAATNRPDCTLQMLLRYVCELFPDVSSFFLSFHFPSLVRNVPTDKLRVQTVSATPPSHELGMLALQIALSETVIFSQVCPLPTSADLISHCHSASQFAPAVARLLTTSYLNMQFTVHPFRHGKENNCTFETLTGFHSARKALSNQLRKHTRTTSGCPSAKPATAGPRETGPLS